MPGCGRCGVRQRSRGRHAKRSETSDRWPLYRAVVPTEGRLCARVNIGLPLQIDAPDPRDVATGSRDCSSEPASRLDVYTSSDALASGARVLMRAQAEQGERRSQTRALPLVRTGHDRSASHQLGIADLEVDRVDADRVIDAAQRVVFSAANSRSNTPQRRTTKPPCLPETPSPPGVHSCPTAGETPCSRRMRSRVLEGLRLPRPAPH